VIAFKIHNGRLRLLTLKHVGGSTDHL